MRFPRLAPAFALAAALAAPLPDSGLADTFPSRPIRLVVPAATGGPTYLTAKMVADHMSETLKQPVVVEPVPGAGGNTGALQVARAAPDGYTLLVATIGTHAINRTLYKTLPFDPIGDFEPVSQLVQYPLVLVATPSLPANTVPELIAYAKANPGKVMRASGGSGTSMHLTGELFRAQAEVDMPHVPYKGSSPALTDLAGGHVQVMFDSLMTAMPLVKAGKLKALGVTGVTRSPIAPDVPTIAEQGLKGYSAFGWIGIVAPKGTPRPVVDTLASAVAGALKDPKIHEMLIAQGAEPVSSTPDAFRAFIADQTKLWAVAVKASGAQVE
ncbi:tripartite tricarboxylate transporter substrate binding protein [Xanthobacter dioxanivorans]|uniref:Tripartite tricarboxylate transporter substrate binding protein n=1 Tax=Xanthobacter dioxanivorans TaxID=2528964 RepID=A0A974PJB9_9HYPH|nr:tripartite tricarboxylate transporter substrate binding protein [Xanthobacter dioxanivorans]QRG04697.1 tripartite tricarboxylate transporter substrate binding protein [Xanthobacter dioxanivorans]